MQGGWPGEGKAAQFTFCCHDLRQLWHGRLVRLLSAPPHLPLTCWLCENMRVPALLCLCPCRGAADDLGQACGHRVPWRRRQPQRAPAPGAAPPSHSAGYAPGTSKPAAAPSCCAKITPVRCSLCHASQQAHASCWLCPQGLFCSTVLNKGAHCSPALCCPCREEAGAGYPAPAHAVGQYRGAVPPSW